MPGRLPFATVYQKQQWFEIEFTGSGILQRNSICPISMKHAAAIHNDRLPGHKVAVGRAEKN